MNKFRIYTLLVVALLLVASPWLTTPEVKAADVVESCSCCDGPCKGCCTQPIEESKETTHDCSCKLSDIPVIPDQPIEVIDTRTDYQLHKDISVNEELVYYQPQVYHYPAPSGVSPPDDYSIPLYIINVSFLI